MNVTTQEAKSTYRWLTFRRAIAAAFTASLAVAGLLPLLGASAAGASTEVTGVAGPTPNPATSAATSVYTFNFTTSASGALGAGVGTITLQGFPAPAAGNTFSGTASKYTVNNVVVTAVAVNNGTCTNQCVVITTPTAIGSNTAVTIGVAGVTNPTVSSGTAESGASLYTSADTTPATIPSYQIVPAPTSVNTVTCCTDTAATGAPANGNPVPSSAGSSAVYHVGFVTSAPTTGALAASTGTISISAPTGTIFPATASDYSVNGVPSGAVTGGGTNKVTLTTPVSVGAGKTADVAISGVTNPASDSGAGYAVSVSTSADTTPQTSGTYHVTPATTAVTTVVCCALSGGNAANGNPSPNGISSTKAEYAVSFTTSASGALSTASDVIVVEFPSGTTLNAGPTLSDFSIDGVTPAAVTENGACPTGATCNAPYYAIQVPSTTLVGSTASVQVLITGTTANEITNPSTAGSSYTVTVLTTADQTPVTSGSYAITSQVTSPTVSVAGNSLQQGFASAYTVGFTATSALAAGSGTITLTAPAGTSFPTATTAYTVSDAATTAASIVASKVVGGGTNVATITTPVAIKAGDAVTVVVSGVTNPTAGTYGPSSAANGTFTVSTSADPSPVTDTSGAYTVVTPMATVSNVVASPSVTNAGASGVTYTVTFKTSQYTQLAATGSGDGTYNVPSGGQILIKASTTTLLAGEAAGGAGLTAADVTVNGVTAATVNDGATAGDLCNNGAGETDGCLSIVSPVNIFPNEVVTVAISHSTNPANGNNQLVAGTVTDQGQTLGTASAAPQPAAGQIKSNWYVIGSGGGNTVGSVSVTPTPAYVGTASLWTVALTPSATGALSAGSGTIVVEGPTGTTFPGSAPAYVVNGVAASTVTVNGGCPSGATCTQPYVTVTTPVLLPASTAGLLVISGVTNPATVGAANATVITSADGSAGATAIAGGFTAVPTSVGSLNGPAANPANGGGTSQWTFTFTASSADCTGSAVYNLSSACTTPSTITLDASATNAGTFPNTATDYVVNNVAAATITSGGGSNNVTFDVPAGVNIVPGGSVTVVVNGVTNGAAKSGSPYYVAVSTNTDTLAVNTAYFGLGTQAAAFDFQAASGANAYLALVGPNPGGASTAGQEFGFKFQPSTTGTLNAGSGTITLTFPTGTVTPSSAGSYTVDGVAASTVAGAGTASVTITVPVQVSNAAPGFIVVTGVTDPPAGSYTVSAMSSGDAISIKSSTFSLGGQVSNVTGPNASPSSAAQTATYTLGFTTSSTGNLTCTNANFPSSLSCTSATQSTVTISDPAGGTVFPATNSDYVFSINGGSPVAGIVSAGGGSATVTVDVPGAVAGSTGVSLTINGVTNPAAGKYTLTVNTSVDTTPMPTAQYTIGTAVSGDGTTTCAGATGVANTAPCVTVTAPGGGAAIGGETGVYTVIFYTSASGALTAGTGTITLSGPTGTVFPSAASDYVITPASGAGTASSTVTGGGTNSVTVTVPVAVTSSSRNTLSVTGVTSAAPGSGLALTMSTSADQVTTQTGAFSLATPPAPTVTAVSPTTGPQGGGTSITITGTSFISGATVSVGGNAATNVKIASTTSITATTPACTGTCTPGTAVDVTVKTSSGTSATGTADQFTYTPGPTVTAISPTSGPAAGGTAVTVTGTGFECGGTSSCVTAVNFGSTAGTAMTVASDTSLTVTSPMGSGTVDVTVVTSQGTSGTSSADQFTYNAPSQGFYLAQSSGKVSAYGSAASGLGDNSGVSGKAPTTGIAVTPSGMGYWELDSDGGIFTFGDAAFYGSMGGKTLNAPINDIASTASGKGYWLLGSDGGVFTFGDAAFYGSMGGKKLNAPIVGLVPTPSGKGYWLIGADGGIFTFGDAGYYGSLPGQKITPAQPVVGAIPSHDGKGYLMIAKDGGVFTFGDATFYGSPVSSGLSTPNSVVGIALTPTGMGYWVAGSDATVYPFGDAETTTQLKSSNPATGGVIGIAAS